MNTPDHAATLARVAEIVREAYGEGFHDGIGAGHPLASGSDRDTEKQWQRSNIHYDLDKQLREALGDEPTSPAPASGMGEPLAVGYALLAPDNLGVLIENSPSGALCVYGSRTEALASQVGRRPKPPMVEVDIHRAALSRPDGVEP